MEGDHARVLSALGRLPGNPLVWMLFSDLGPPLLLLPADLRRPDQMLEEVDAAFDAAGARLLAGRALEQAGEQDAAAAELERARAAFDAFGSVRHPAEAERELRKLGRHIHRRTKTSATGEGSVGSLTGRELELARLVVDRKTNPQIAAQLFLSQKTVETHLRNIFRKAWRANRVELARVVEHAERPELSGS